ncbi:MAG: S41 family peptidase [Chloroflexota bacterium]
MTAGYYRFPTIYENTVVFVSEDDLWSVPVNGGIARRLTNHLGEVSHPIFSPDGEYLAFVGREEGAPEVYIMPAKGGSARRLTYLSSRCRVLGWNSSGTHILFSSSYGQMDYGEMSLYQIHHKSANGHVEALNYGPARSIAFGHAGQVVLGRNTGDPALWKRYRGGTAGHLWINPKASKGGIGTFERLLPDLQGNVASPMWVKVKNRNRVFFISDHEGIGNLYSCTPNGKDLRRHTDHEEYYARNPTTDGTRIVYHAGADLFIYDVGAESSTELLIEYYSPRIERNRKFVSPMSYLNSAELHPSGKAITITTRGKPFTFYNHEGPIFQHGKRDGIRYRQPIWFNDSERLLMLSDELGEETFEIHYMDFDKEPLVIEGLDIGRPVQLNFSPTSDKLALTNHRHELILIDFEGVDQPPQAEPAESNTAENLEQTAVGKDDAEEAESTSTQTALKPQAVDAHQQNDATDGDATDDDSLPSPTCLMKQPQLTVVDRSPVRRIAGFDWSPDGNWIAYGYGATQQTTAIRLYQLPDPDGEDEAEKAGAIHTITRPVLHDFGPSFAPDGQHLYFISAREFNPIYDALQSVEMSFPWGMRPYLVTLQNDVPNPFIPRPEMDDDLAEPGEEDGEEDGEGNESEEAAEVDGEDETMEDGADEDQCQDAPEGLDEADGELEGEVDEDSVLVVSNSVTPEAASTVSNGQSISDSDEADKSTSTEEKSRVEKSKEEKDKANGSDDKSKKEKLKIDLEGIERRILAFPVPDGRYGQVAGVHGKALFTVFPVQGELGSPYWEDEQEYGGALRTYDFKEYRSDLLAERVNSFKLSRNRKRLLYYSGGRLRVVNSGEKAPGSSGGSRKSGWIDTYRVRVSVDPPMEWQQMLREAWRLQRDYFWTEDMSGIDWVVVYERYQKLVDRASTRREISDLIWEMQGELGTSHAYEGGGDYPYSPYYFQGTLGATFIWDPAEGGYVTGEPIVGDPWDPYATSPLAAPGVDVKAGDVLIAVNGQRLDAETSPAQLLVGYAWSEVLLTFKARPAENQPVENQRIEKLSAEGTDLKGRTKSDTTDDVVEVDKKKATGTAEQDKDKPPYRSISVKTLWNETPARYRAWVEDNRKKVHEATNGRIGYVHIPDMMAFGYAEFHRGYLAETDRDGLIIDVRYNGGGHVSQLILEKLARRRIAFDQSRWGGTSPYPADSVAGPLVALTNEMAGSDGDIFCHSFKLMKLGPLIGKRTWGGVIGISPKQELLDGGITTQPEYSYWFEDVGWSVENYGTDPDIEVEFAPQDYAEGRDPQLERAIEEAEKLLETTPILKPDLENRPNLALPKLPSRKKRSGK